MIAWEDLLGTPYSAMDCRAVAVEVSRRAGRACPPLERPQDFEGWESVGPGWASDARPGDVVLARDDAGGLFAIGVVGREIGLTACPSQGVICVRSGRVSHTQHTYRWPK